jgi:GrpB-like predicted nucleotidyltransferase (UPF0157 family)
MSGLSLHELKLTPPDPVWAALFSREAKRLRAVTHQLATEHIGSTAIPAIQAKPVVDIAMMVDVAPDDESVKQALQNLGYESRGEYGLPGRQFFTLGDPPSVHLHVVARGSQHWADWIDFRDYLLRNTEWAARFEEEKLRLLKECGADRALYTKSKGAFVRKVLAFARR